MILNDIPFIEVVFENPFMEKRYPQEGSILAVLDTSYEGFALVPENIFRELGLDEFSLLNRELILPNGFNVQSRGVYGKVELTELGIAREGFIETAEGIDEVVLGVNFVKGLRIVLDYCINRLDVEVC